MAKIIPHRRLHEQIAVNPARLFCPQCFQDTCGEALVLHHDHLLNFARDVLERCCHRVGTEKAWNTLWDREGYRFFVARRFDPIYVCQTCNTGDGWGKTAGWCNKPSIYPPSMSLTVQEMAGVRRMPKGNARWQAVAALWKKLRSDHEDRRQVIVGIALNIAQGDQVK